MSRRSERERQADALHRLSSSLEKLAEAARPKPERIGSVSTPRRLPFDVYARAVPGLASQFERRIPTEFWSLDIRRSRERPVAVIACPCGEEPESEAGVPVVCECGRAYVYDGDHVHIAFSPAKSREPTEA